MSKESQHRFSAKKFRVAEGQKVKLDKIDTDSGKDLSDKTIALDVTQADVSFLQEAQQKLFAAGSHSVLIILQGMDAAGKDGIIRHVMNGVNPQGCRVHSFKAPNSEELQHHFLWRPMRYLPERGMISIFNRSYYEEVLVVRVHPDFLKPQKLPKLKDVDSLWEQRFEEIKQFEKTLVRSGVQILKFFLHVSKKEQGKRLLERLEDPAKHWKFNEGDLVERNLWKDYQDAYEDMLASTSTKKAPWYIVPADDKWYARAVVADIIAQHVDELKLEYPTVTSETKSRFGQLAQQLREEVQTSE